MHGSISRKSGPTALAALCIGLMGVAAWPTGCGSSPKTATGGGGATSPPATSSPAGRPLVGRTAAETYASVPTGDGGPEATAVSQLNFFDELEAMPIVSRDDALHACLLLGAGVSPSTYDERVAIATKLKWLHKTWKLPGNPHEAVTTGEVSHMLVRMMGAKKRLSPNRATQRLINLGLLPERVKFNQGISGAQLVALLGEVQDTLGAAGIRGTGGVFADLPDDEDGDVFVAVVEPRNSPSTDGTDQLLAENRAKARPEPLPEVQMTESLTKPALVAPTAAPPPASAPAPSPAANEEPAKPNPWVRGQPLKRPAKSNEPK